MAKNVFTSFKADTKAQLEDEFKIDWLKAKLKIRAALKMLKCKAITKLQRNNSANKSNYVKELYPQMCISHATYIKTVHAIGTCIQISIWVEYNLPIMVYVMINDSIKMRKCIVFAFLHFD